MSNKYISEQSNQFKNKIIIVTGSTQGSGAETAKLLASRGAKGITICGSCLLYTSPSPRDRSLSRMPSSA